MKIDLEKVQFDIDAQMHILRHFIKIDEEYRNRLTNISSFTINDINKQQNIVGSKFFYEFSTNPILLWERIKSKIFDMDFSINNKKVEFTIQFIKEKYPLGIGNSAIAHINDLSLEEKQNIEIQNRDGYDVKIIHRQKLPTTWNASVILVLEQNNYKIKTIFPGELAPPLPGHVIKKLEEYNSSIEYWNNHLFVKSVY